MARHRVEILNAIAILDIHGRVAMGLGDLSAGNALAMIEFTQGDILKANVEALVNPVNCSGVMGRGLALEFKHAFPANFAMYATACKRRMVQPGQMLTHDTGHAMPRWIINFPTKRHWRDRSRLEDIEAGMAALRDEIEARGIRSIAVPPLGCGLGGLEWRMVSPVICGALRDLEDVRVLLFEPIKT